jgi:hypothetical protein
MYYFSTLYHKPRLVLTAWLLAAGPLWTQAQQAGTVNSRPTLHAIPDQQVKALGDSRFIDLSGITAGDETGQTTSIAVRSSNDKLFEHLQVIPTSNGHAVLQYAVKKGVTGNAAITISVTDDGTPAATVSRSFNMAVVKSSYPAQNSKPTLDPIKNYETRSSGDSRFIPLSGITAGREPNQATSIAVSSSNDNLFDALSVNPTSNGSAILQYYPKKGASGEATVTVTVSDDGKPAASISKTFTISLKPPGKTPVKPDNTRPTLDGIRDQVVRSAAGVRFIALSGITPGKESGQATRLTVTNSNNRLVESMNIDPLSNGTALIQYGIRPGAYGVSRVSVTVTDDGDEPETIARSFILTVKRPGKAPKKEPLVVSRESGMALSGFPNPFYKKANISFSTRVAQHRVNLDVYDAAGVRVQQLFNGSTQAGRTYNIPVDGAGLAAGVYMIRMTTDQNNETIKMVLVK